MRKSLNLSNSRNMEPGTNLKISTIRLDTIELASYANYLICKGVSTSDVHQIVKIMLQEIFNNLEDRYKFKTKEDALQWLRHNGFPIARMSL